jgi:flagellar basal-body rod modification protein FlgD
MKIEGLSHPDPSARGATTAAPKDEFLRLLVAQLQHQDPLQPRDGAEFVAQLAQLAGLEQSAETNARLAAIEAGQASSIRAGYAAMVGSTITAAVDRVPNPPGPQDPAIYARVDGTASKVSAVIKNASGKELRRIELGPTSGGELRVPWDGVGSDNKPLPAGDLSIEIVAEAPGGAAVSAQAMARGPVTAVAFEGGAVRFSLGSLEVSPGDIISIEAPRPATAPAVAGTERTEQHVDLDVSDYWLERLGRVWPSD